VLINGFNHLACKTLVRDVGTRITVEALPSLRVLKDLIVDMEPFFDQYRSILPYLVNDEPVPDTERLQSQAERARFDDTTKCILCAACTSSCPVFMGDKRYVGPQAIVAAHRFILDSRDRAAAERLSLLNDNSGTSVNSRDARRRGGRRTRAARSGCRAAHGSCGGAAGRWSPTPGCCLPRDRPRPPRRAAPTAKSSRGTPGKKDWNGSVLRCGD
jgi:succinate dehydrogenase / fumarate reductase iron-sulfur subunit